MRLVHIGAAEIIPQLVELGGRRRTRWKLPIKRSQPPEEGRSILHRRRQSITIRRVGDTINHIRQITIAKKLLARGDLPDAEIAILASRSNSLSIRRPRN